MKLLIDTNVILDALMHREPWADSAGEVLLAVAEEKADGFVTASSFTDLYYILRKHTKDDEQTRQTLLGLLAVINVLDVNGSDCEKAFELPLGDYEDALQASCAKRHRVDHIVTRDEKHYEGSPVKIISPKDILKKL
ncbi:MAG: PIN domain-containing protein [Christensenellaceae bacterium]|jgi:predicted nucleic acid-binding protein|nr:PIN domain-containing protein [Christensenellaceae bacterium]